MAVNTSRSAGKLVQMVQECPQCGNELKCRRRDFSEQALSILLAWGEIEEETVDQPICEACYDELRELLIDRSAEVAQAIAHPEKLVAQSATATRSAKQSATAAAKNVAATGKKVAPPPRTKPQPAKKKSKRVA